MEIVLTILGALLGFLGFKLFSNMKASGLEVKHAEDKAKHEAKINQIDEMIKEIENKKIVVEKRPSDLTDEEKAMHWEDRLLQTNKDKK